MITNAWSGRLAALAAMTLALGTWSSHVPRLVAQDAATVIHRVNAGGAVVSGTPSWSADPASAPSPRVNAAATGNTTHETWLSVDASHPSLPFGTPETLFQSERWDLPASPQLQWSFPVSPGIYVVRLYFAEIYFSSAGERVFDVFIEGTRVLQNYDIVADVGALRGVMKSFPVTADASLDIVFGHVVENPKISAIEILSTSTSSSRIGVSPTSLDFGTVLMGQRAARSVQLTNLGGPGDPSLDVYATTLTGADAAQFTVSFGSTVTLAPGQSTTLAVEFVPGAAGVKTAALDILHFGQNSPSVIPLSGIGAAAAAGTWQTLASAPLARHEISYVHAGGNFYLTGDRGFLDHEVYSAASGTWDTAPPLPREFHHAQAVEFGGRIYYLGGLAGPYPDHVTGAVHIFDPATSTWSEGTPMPAARARGGGGTAVYNGKLYVAGGLQDEASGTGHDGVSVGLFDVYDPLAGTWTALPSKPRGRDHFHAAVVGDKFYAIGGRKGGDPDFFNAVIAAVDVYDFTSGAWSTLPASSNIPTPRAGSGVAALGNEIIIIGGEGNGRAYDNVEAFNTLTGTWRTLAPMPTARHGVQAAVCNGAVYVAAGAASQGGGDLTNAHEVFFLGNATGCGSGQPSPPPPPPVGAQYRVNAGGASIAGTPIWSTDLASAPSALVNAASTGNTTHETWLNVETAHPSLPAGTPASLFQSERWDLPGSPEMQWNFPVTPGNYQVRLYFAEIYFSRVGERVFDVSIEGNVVLDDYDIVADVGALNGVMKSFVVTADASLDIVFGHVIENPKISAIEIVPLVASPGQLGASPTTIDFGMVVLGQSKAQTLQLTNLGGAGAPDIVIDATTITGAGANQFTDDFNDAGSVTLAPGQSMMVTASFLPTSNGAKSASLQIAHSGGNAPLVVLLAGNGALTAAIGFGKSALSGTMPLTNPTSLQFGPDGRLYVAQQEGLIRIYTVARAGANNYVVAGTETIAAIQSVPNHDDDGTPNPDVTTRLITGILVVGTAAVPVIYVAHSDPRIGGGPSGDDLQLDTNSTMISRLTWTGSTWQKLDLVRGLPRSEENHAANGMHLDAVHNKLYVAMGGNTNKGATSNNFAYLPEFALSAAILTIDLTAIGDATYDLPTLDDEDRPGNPDPGDPFGGNNGKNQAMLVPGGPVQVYAPGFRNPYDLVMTHSGRLYTIDNGGNAGWGDIPIGAGPAGVCTNAPNEPGTTSPDSLHLVTGPGYYGGHPNPTRANMANTFNASNPQSPVAVANPIECEYREAGPESGALAVFPESTNGLTEYTATNFGGAMQGNLLAASWDNVVYRVQLDATGTVATSVSPLFSTVGALPLDLDALGPDTPFPGTIWVGDYWTHAITVFEPIDYEPVAPPCSGANDPNLDEDGDGYSNKDEIDNGTNPCSAGDVPPDWDGDFISDLNDPDDDNDGLPDVSDPFALDPFNGLATTLPVTYLWENDGSNPGGILNLGFTGLMTNGVSDYVTLFDRRRMTAGGAAGVLTVDQVSEGDALGALNNQEYGLQFGVRARPADTGAFFVHTRILGPFSGLTPQDGQSFGLFVGTGDQDNYAKMVVSGTSGGTIGFLTEVGDTISSDVWMPLTLPGPAYVDLYLRVDPGGATVQPFYSVTSGGVTGPQIVLAAPRPIPASWFTNPVSGLAVGIVSTSRGPGPEFPATWDFIRAIPATAVPALAVSPAALEFGSVEPGHSRSLHVQLTHNGGPETSNLVIDATEITGTASGQFQDDFNDAGTLTLRPGDTATLTVTFAPAAGGASSAALAIAHSGSTSPSIIALSGTGAAPASTGALYRVNAGGPSLGGTPAWSADTWGAPASYVKVAAIGNLTHETGADVDGSDPSVPAGTPAGLFATERWALSAPDMQWSFPVAPGSYEVRLYFAEIYFSSAGERVFDVLIEGARVLHNYDIAADVGAFRGVMKSFTVVADSSLDIVFGHVVEHPKISAIEIRAAATGASVASQKAP